MLHQIRTQLLIVIICFLLLVLGSFSASFLYIQDHNADEIAKEIIEENRISVQRLSWLARIDPGNPSIPILIEKINDNIESVPQNGLLIPLEGEPHKLPISVEGSIRKRYESIAQLWPEYKERLDTLRSLPQNSPSGGGDSVAFQAISREIVNHIDAAAADFENHISDQHAQLRLLQLGFIIIAMPLVIVGIYIIGFKIVRPLNILNQSADQIRGGDLRQPVTAIWEDEIGQLAHSMEAMRAQIFTNQQNLEANIAERTHELTVAAKFSQEIARKMDAEQIIKSVTSQAQDLFQAKEVSLCLLSPDGKYIQMVSNSSQLLTDQRPQQQLNEDLILAHKGTSQVTNIANSGCLFLQGDPTDHCLSAKLEVGGKIIGALCVLHEQNQTFNENEQRAFTLLANSASVALYNQQLIEQGKFQASEAAKLAERQRLASELHDDLAQNLEVYQMQVNQILSSLSGRENTEIIEVLEKLQGDLYITQEQVRMAISGLSSGSNSSEPRLRAEIEACIADFQTISNIPIELSISDTPWENATATVRRQILLILREALINIRRHSQAKSAQISIFKDEEYLTLLVEDDGKGFEPEHASRDGHFGLEIMNARAERSGGTFNIKSSPSSGTSIKARFPLNKISTDPLEIGERILE